MRTVNGVGQLTWISATSRTSVPQDFSAIPAEAIVQDPAGNLVHIPAVAGTGAALGTFTIAGVPNGDYILHSGNQYLLTSTNSPDLGSSRGGRPNQIPLVGPANLNFSLTNLAPWQTGDTLELFSTEVDDWDFQTESRLLPDPANGFPGVLFPGQTTLDFSLDVKTLDATAAPALIQGSVGDHLYFAQLSSATSTGGVSYQALSRLVQFPLFDLVDGNSVALSGALVDVQKGNTIAFDYRGSAFKSQIATEGNPKANLSCANFCGGFLGVLAQAGTSADGFYTANADLLLLPDPGGADLLTGLMTYGSPVGAGLVGNWGLIGLARWGGRVNHKLPGKFPVSFGAFSGIDWTADPAALAAPAVLTPPLSFPRNIQIDGQPFFSDQTLGSQTPTVSWTAPALGVPTRYELSILELGLTPNGLRTEYIRPNVARIITADTSFKVLPGLLLSGHSYVVSISAIQAPSAGNAPFRAVLESVSVTTPSGVLVAP